MASSSEYTPELAAILQTFGGMQTCLDGGGSAAAVSSMAAVTQDRVHKERLGRESTSLIQLVYRAIFGSVPVMEALTLYWLETLPHPPARRDSDNSAAAAAATAAAAAAPEYETIAGILHTLAMAPAVPCVRVHRVGASNRLHVVFHPFGIGGGGGGGGGGASALVVPLEHADPRLIRAVQHLVMNPWAFRHMDEDPTFGFFTLSCFAYDCEAQQELDACRPVMLCAAMRAIMLRIRNETGRTPAPRKALQPSGGGGGGKGNTMRSPTLTYVRATAEERIREKIERTTLAAARWPRERGGKSPQRELLHDVFQFVCHDRTITSLPHPRVQKLRKEMARAGVTPPGGGPSAANSRGAGVRHSSTGGVEYALLPTHADIYVFSDQVIGEWLRLLNLSRAHASSAMRARLGGRRGRV